MHNHSDFLQVVLAEFPELRQEISDCDGLPYLEMGTFASFTQKAKGAEDWEVYGRAVRLTRTSAMSFLFLTWSILISKDRAGSRHGNYFPSIFSTLGMKS